MILKEIMLEMVMIWSIQLPKKTMIMPFHAMVHVTNTVFLIKIKGSNEN